MSSQVRFLRAIPVLRISSTPRTKSSVSNAG
jgi:hypothetical protein